MSFYDSDPSDLAKHQQSVFDDAHRLLDTRNHGVGCFPTFLLICLERRVWESTREAPSGKPIAPVSFHDFVHASYPVGLASTYDALEVMIAADPKLVAEWQRVSGRTIDNAPMALALTAIRADGGTQSRAAIDPAVVADYQENLEKLPPIVVFYDGADYWIADGFHRVDAHKQAGRDSIIAEVRQGTRRDAVLYSVGANAAHGLRRTNADKRRAVELLLGDEEWAKKSNRWIASKCSVSPDTVDRHRREQVPDSGTCQKFDAPRLGQDGKAYPAKQSTQRKPAPELVAPPAPAPLPAVAPQPHVAIAPEEPVSRMRQMNIYERVDEPEPAPLAEPQSEPQLAQVHRLEGLAYNAACRAVERLSDAEWRTLMKRENERRDIATNERALSARFEPKREPCEWDGDRCER